ncbi:MAG: site-specific DNA-methyltransferase [Methanobacteriaceae archaeon]
MKETKLSGESLDIVSENVSELKELFPEIVTEDKIDFDKLKLVLGKYIEDDNERYNFTWKGKSAALRLAQTPSTGTLRPCKEESKNWDTTGNLFIEGDNLEVLKLLQKSYYGKIKMIYIDPPYNTGKDFIYKDNYQDNLKNYLKLTGQVNDNGFKISNNTDSSGRYHTNWLNMMYPRLRLARNLLSEEGIIFISIDDNEVDNLKKMCNEVFGEENFVNTFIKQSKVGGGSDSKFIVKEHEYVIVYAKNALELSEMFIGHDISYLKRYKEKDEKGKFFWDTFARPGLQIKAQESLVYQIECPDGSKLKKRWIRSKSRFEKDLKNGIIRFIKKSDGTWSVQFKQYLNVSGKKPRSLTSDLGGTIEGKNEIRDLFGNDKMYSYPKSSKFIKFLLKLCTNNSDLILDFFAGSATTAHGVMEFNAINDFNIKYIMVQLPELIDENDEAFKKGYKNICEIGKERIRRAGDKIISEMNPNSQTTLDSEPNTKLDTGFKVFKLDSSNLSKWDPEYDNLKQTLLDSVENLVPGRNQLDLVYEIMLKYGIDLTLSIEEYQVQDKKFYSIGSGALIICLNDNLTSDLAFEIIKLKDELSPEVMRVVFKDNGFASDSDKTNIKQTLKTNGIEEFVTI